MKDLNIAGYNDIVCWFHKAKDNKFTHLMVVRYDNDYDFPIMVSPADTALDIYNELVADLSLEVLDVYKTSEDFLPQFRMYNCFNF